MENKLAIEYRIARTNGYPANVALAVARENAPADATERHVNEVLDDLRIGASAMTYLYDKVCQGILVKVFIRLEVEDISPLDMSDDAVIVASGRNYRGEPRERLQHCDVWSSVFNAWLRVPDLDDYKPSGMARGAWNASKRAKAESIVRSLERETDDGRACVRVDVRDIEGVTLATEYLGCVGLPLRAAHLADIVDPALDAAAKSIDAIRKRYCNHT